jgi:hypothetical protein
VSGYSQKMRVSLWTIALESLQAVEATELSRGAHWRGQGEQSEARARRRAGSGVARLGFAIAEVAL